MAKKNEIAKQQIEMAEGAIALMKTAADEMEARKERVLKAVRAFMDSDVIKQIEELKAAAKELEKL